MVPAVIAMAIFSALQAPKSVADGVYTTAQADRGKSAFQEHCSACHGPDLSGGIGPALVGERFTHSWEARSVESLFRNIVETMPATAVASATDEEKIDVVAYILQQNGFPAGAAELTRDEDKLATIQMSLTGSGSLRAGAVVRVVGCLAQRADHTWMLQRATDPEPSRIGGEAAAGTPAPLGTQEIRLLNLFPDPSAHSGHKMQANGLLVRDASGLAVNVLSLDMLAPNCEP